VPCITTLTPYQRVAPCTPRYPLLFRAWAPPQLIGEVVVVVVWGVGVWCMEWTWVLGQGRVLWQGVL
jgi:hypothetical protein